MKSLKCPECEAPIKILGKGESFEGWRQCHKCGELTQILAPAEGEISTQSLQNMLTQLKKDKIGIQVIQFIKDNGVAHEKDIMFCVGKKSRTYLDLLTNAQILENNGKKYRIKQPFEQRIKDYIRQEIMDKSYNRRKASEINPKITSL